ncbi:hypothetical protein RJ640_000509 [Escallonia rubra]|uniref:FAR1 domain-containing protein n=1 Tax=Escallonia rubra TaxID=112253 RepID=A0AA88URX5_9ASTE|nr:hypothetical protein RJ640_000509 [Escallonia rubra]
MIWEEEGGAAARGGDGRPLAEGDGRAQSFAVGYEMVNTETPVAIGITERGKGAGAVKHDTFGSSTVVYSGSGAERPDSIAVAMSFGGLSASFIFACQQAPKVERVQIKSSMTLWVSLPAIWPSRRISEAKGKPKNYHARTPRENEGCENFDNFDSQLIDGKTFDTLEAAYDFYNQYALSNGFSSRKHNAHKIRATVTIFRRQFVCNKEGFKKLDDKRPNVNEKRRRDLRTGCEAMMQVTLSKKFGVWVVDKFQDVHNHPLTTTPSKVIKHRSHSKYHCTNVCKSLVSDLNHEGLKASQITRL